MTRRLSPVGDPWIAAATEVKVASATAVDPGRSAGFYAAIRRYWPELPDGCLVPAYAGIRPKIVPPSVAKQDFRITGPQDHGVNGLIHLFGIESPGLTASLAIAEHVKALMAH